MKKNIIFLLFCISLSAQEFKTVGDTATLKTLVWNQPVLLLQYGGSTFDRTGGGIFQVIDSTYSEGTNAFDHPWSGKQWARIGLIDPTPTLNSLTITGTATLTTVSLDSLVSCGVDSFATTAATDTVTISGASVDDIYIITGKFTSAIDQQDILQYEPLAGKLVVHRMASGESGLAYAWIRFKNH